MEEREEKEKKGSPSNAKKTKNKDRESNLNSGGSFDLNMSIDSAMKQLKELKENCDKQQRPGESVKCLKQSCGREYQTGSGDFCTWCGSNQNVQEAAQLKRINMCKTK